MSTGGQGKFEVAIKVDDTEFDRQVKRIQDIMNKAHGAISPIARPATAVSGMAGDISGKLGRLTSIFSRGKEGGGEKEAGKGVKAAESTVEGIKSLITKVATIAGIAIGVSTLVSMIIQASPLLRSINSLINTGVMFMLRPIGDFIGFLLRPVAIMFLKFSLQFYRDVFPTVKALGEAGGKAIAKFFGDPIGALAGLGKWIVDQLFNNPIAQALFPIPAGIAIIVDWVSKFKWPTWLSDFKWPQIKFEWPKLDLGQIQIPDFLKSLVNWKWPKFDFTAPKWLTDLIKWIWPAFTNAITGVGQAFVNALTKWVWPSLEGGIRTIKSWVDGMMKWKWPDLGAGVQSVKNWVSSMFNWKWPSLEDAIRPIKQWLDNLLNWKWPELKLPSLGGGGDILGGLGKSVSNLFGGGNDSGAKDVNNWWDSIKGFFGGASNDTNTLTSKWQNIKSNTTQVETNSRDMSSSIVNSAHTLKSAQDQANVILANIQAQQAALNAARSSTRKAQFGMNELISAPATLNVAENEPEFVSVTPLSKMRGFSPTASGGKAMSVNLTVNAPISIDRVGNDINLDELTRKIKTILNAEIPKAMLYLQTNSGKI